MHETLGHSVPRSFHRSIARRSIARSLDHSIARSFDRWIARRSLLVARRSTLVARCWLAHSRAVAGSLIRAFGCWLAPSHMSRRQAYVAHCWLAFSSLVPRCSSLAAGSLTRELHCWLAPSLMSRRQAYLAHQPNQTPMSNPAGQLKITGQ